MPTLADELAADLAAAIAGYDQTCTWSGLTLPCVRMDSPAGLDIEEGGDVVGIDYRLVIAKAAFPGGIFPVLGDLINGTHQIKRIAGAIAPAAAELRLDVGSVDT